MIRLDVHQKMKAAFFRADSSASIGAGHVMRCLALAELLLRNGFAAAFLCRPLEGNLIKLIRDKGYTCHVVSEDVKGDWGWEHDCQYCMNILAAEKQEIDLLVVDNYEIDFNWERPMRAYAKKIMVIDDLANRSHDCDILLDQNFVIDGSERYKTLIPPACRLLLGPRYILLRPEILKAKAGVVHPKGTIRRIFVFYGGGDLSNETVKAVNGLLGMGLDNVGVDIVIGEANPHKSEIAQVIKDHPNCSLHVQVNNVGALMVAADLALGAGGINTWERCFLGLPTIATAVAENQVPSLQSLGSVGAVLYLGTASQVSQEDICHAVGKLIDDPELLARLANKGLELMTHDAVSTPVALIMEAINA